MPITDHIAAIQAADSHADHERLTEIVKVSHIAVE
jgi:hypothetical protein